VRALDPYANRSEDGARMLRAPSRHATHDDIAALDKGDNVTPCPPLSESHMN
jgi:hypothetical protein